MIFNCFDWVRDDDTPKVHPTQKPVPLLENIIRIFTDEGDVVIDPTAGSGTTLLTAALTLGWAVQMCLCLTLDIKKGGAEL